MAEFKIGDVVCLKSGSPDMTISGIGLNFSNDRDINYWRCEWFDKDHKAHFQSFHKDMLQLAEDSPLMAGAV